MEIKDFIEHFADQFDDTELSEFKPETEFHDLDEYTSVIALSIILMIDEEYGHLISGADVRARNTVKELYEYVESL